MVYKGKKNHKNSTLYTVAVQTHKWISFLSPLLHLPLPPGRYQCQRGWWVGGACGRPWQGHWPPPHNVETPPHLGGDTWAAEISYTHSQFTNFYSSSHSVYGKQCHQDPECVSVWQSETHPPVYRLVFTMLLSDSSTQWDAVLTTYRPECREHTVHNRSLFTHTHTQKFF